MEFGDENGNIAEIKHCMSSLFIIIIIIIIPKSIDPSIKSILIKYV